MIPVWTNEEKKQVSVWINHEKKKSPFHGSVMDFVVLPEFLTMLGLALIKMQSKQILTALQMIFFSETERFLLCHLRSGLRDAAREGWMESSFILLSLCILISAVFSPTPFTGMKISFLAKIFCWYKPEKLNPINEEIPFQSDSLFFNKGPERESFLSYSQMMPLFSNSRQQGWRSVWSTGLIRTV